MRLLLPLIVLAGCGMSTNDYVVKRAELDCDYALRCYEPAVLTLYGWSDLETCQADREGFLAWEAEGCTLDKKAARQCLKEMKDRDCPQGEPVFPDVCAAVFTECEGKTDDTDDGVDSGA